MNSTRYTNPTEFLAEFGITLERYFEIKSHETSAIAIDQSTMQPLVPYDPLGELERPWPATDAFYAGCDQAELRAYRAANRY